MELSVFEICGLRLRSHGSRRISIKRGARVRVRVRVRFSVNPNPNPRTAFFEKKKKEKNDRPRTRPRPQLRVLLTPAPDEFSTSWNFLHQLGVPFRLKHPKI